jgi:hypothetical protein
MNAIFWTFFFLAAFLPKDEPLYKDFTNLTGFSIGMVGLTVNGGFPEIYRKTGKPEYLIMTGLFSWVVYDTTKSQIELIKSRNDFEKFRKERCEVKENAEVVK